MSLFACDYPHGNLQDPKSLQMAISFQMALVCHTPLEFSMLDKAAVQCL
jgi:hypothetical protein